MRKNQILEALVGGLFGGGFILTLRERDAGAIGGYILMAASLISACIIKATKEPKTSSRESQ